MNTFSFPTFADDLADRFRHPPASAEPKVLWMWMNGNVTRAGITHDLEAMKQVGIGGNSLSFQCGGSGFPILRISRELFRKR